ncbi:MAG: hypothetical protein ABS37_17040 [Acidovorax sp. SCN 65-108]|nr:MAG: hypothetical protein ABS37_17040 [Acidovorax sp. SCN 65-108]
MDSPMHLDMDPDDYQRLRDAAQRRALELREDAVREATDWMARAVAGALQGVVRIFRPLAAPHHTCNTELKTPCQPSF